MSWDDIVPISSRGDNLWNNFNKNRPELRSSSLAGETELGTCAGAPIGLDSDTDNMFTDESASDEDYHPPSIVSPSHTVLLDPHSPTNVHDNLRAAQTQGRGESGAAVPSIEDGVAAVNHEMDYNEDEAGRGKVSEDAASGIGQELSRESEAQADKEGGIGGLGVNDYEIKNRNDIPDNNTGKALLVSSAFDSRLPRSPVPAPKARGRPRRHRPTILAESANWAVNKIHGDMQTVQGRLLKVEATAWIAEKDLSNLHDFIAEYRRTLEGKEKKIIGVRKSSRRKIKH